MFAMAVPAGWGDETRRYVEDRISVDLQVTCERHVQTLVQEAVNSVKAFFDIAVQAMNDKADQVVRSTMQNEDTINGMDDALSRLVRLESASTYFRSSELECWYINSQGQHRLQGGVEEYGELRDEEWTCLPRLGQRW